MATKLDIAVIFTLAATCALWIEQGHHVVIDEPTPSELVSAAAATVKACPDNDGVPYSANCLAFLFGTNSQSDVQNPAPNSDPAPKSGIDPLGTTAACPDRDDVPYSAGCLAYLQGATALGMRWRIRAPHVSAPVIQPVPVASAR
jgi:hypothetical protein